MGYVAFTGKLDEPSKFVPFSGELDREPQVELPPVSMDDQLRRVTPSTPQNGASTFTATRAPDAGGGRGFVNPAQIGDSNASARVVTNAAKSAIAGVYEMAESAGVAAMAPAKAIDFVNSLITGREQTAAQDYVGKTFIDPNVTAAKHWSPKEEEQPEIVDKVVNGLARMVPTLATAILTGGAGAASEATMGAEAVRQSIANGMRNMSVPAFSAGVAKAADLIQRGASLQEAVTAGLTEGATSDITGGLAMSTPGANVAKRFIEGAAVGATTGDVSRQAQNLASPSSQTERTPEGVLVSAIIGGTLAGAMKHPAQPGAKTRGELGYADAEPLPRTSAPDSATGDVAAELRSIRPLSKQPDANKVEPQSTANGGKAGQIEHILSAPDAASAIAEFQNAIVETKVHTLDEPASVTDLSTGTNDSLRQADADSISPDRSVAQSEILRREIELASLPRAQDVGARTDVPGLPATSNEGRTPDAIAGVESGRGVDDSEKRSVATGDVLAEPAGRDVPLDTGDSDAIEPAREWLGRSGDGYKTVGDASVALPTRQQRFPDLEWKIEPMESGKFRLAGYDTGALKSGNADARTNPVVDGQVEGAAPPANGDARAISKVDNETANPQVVKALPGAIDLETNQGVRSYASHVRPNVGVQGDNRSNRVDNGDVSRPTLAVSDSGVVTVLHNGDKDGTRLALKDAGITNYAPVEGGYQISKSQSQKAQAEFAAPQENAVEPLRIGLAPGNAEAVTVKDGVVHVGEKPAIDFNSGDPITVAEGATDAQIKQALRDGGAVSKHGKFYGGEKSTAASPEQPTAAQPSAVDDNVAAQGVRLFLGRDSVDLTDGGKPFESKYDADQERKNQPMMRTVKVDGGFALTPKSDALIAAQEAAAKRLAIPRTSASGEPIPAHSFIAAEGGLSQSEMQDAGFDRNVRIGNRQLFAAPGKGLTIAEATERLIQDGYLPQGSGHNEAYALIKRSVTDPQYTPDGYERIAEAERQTSYEDHLKSHQESDRSFVPDDESAAEEAGYHKASPEVKTEFQALHDLAQAKGIDTESLLEDVAHRTQDATEEDYYAAAKAAVTKAIEGSNRTDREISGEEGNAGEEPQSPTAIANALTLKFGGQTYQVASLADAQAKWNAFVDRSGGGVSEVGNGVRIFDGDGKEVGRVSYNGRLWGPGEDGPLMLEADGSKPIQEPQAPPALIPSPADLTAPTRADIERQQERADNAPALGQREQIDREASAQTLTRPTAPEQRTDTSGDMFAREKAQAEIDKRNAGTDQTDDGTIPMFSRGEENSPGLQSAIDAHEEAKAALEAHGDEPPRPSSEQRRFGEAGREGASPKAVDRYDAEVKAYNDWRPQYLKLKKAEVETSNARFNAERADRADREDAARAETDRAAQEAEAAKNAPPYYGENHEALAGRDITLEVATDTGKTAKMTMDAQKAMQDLDRRAAALEEVRKCLG